jgi:hypothetical protein
MHRLSLVAFCLAVATTTLGQTARASCGANFCAVNLTRATHAADVVTPRFDLRFEYIDQDQPRICHDSASVGAIPGHHDEVRTINRNLIATLDLPLGPDWGLSVQLPFVSRDHSHIHNHHGAQLLETWDIDAIGDARVLARRALARRDDGGWTLIGGAKLPTGNYDETNADGQVAERTLQPGSGTTDAVVGAHYEVTTSWHGTARRFAAVQVQTPLREREHYRPGTQYQLDIGADYALAPQWKGLLQLNAQIKRRDHGSEAEPDNTGGSFVWLSPGAAYAIGKASEIYGVVQLPLYQRVNGIQLTADYALIVGFNTRF